VTRRASVAGTWVCGTMSGTCSGALVLPEHADCPEWKIGECRISKLWVQPRGDKDDFQSGPRGGSGSRGERKAAS